MKIDIRAALALSAAMLFGNTVAAQNTSGSSPSNTGQSGSATSQPGQSGSQTGTQDRSNKDRKRSDGTGSSESQTTGGQSGSTSSGSTDQQGSGTTGSGQSGSQRGTSERSNRDRQDGSTNPSDSGSGAQGGAQSTELTTVSGKLTAAGADNVLTVTDAQNTEQKITVTAETKLTKGGKEATPADFKQNDTVTVRAKKGPGGTMTAVSINIEGQ